MARQAGVLLLSLAGLLLPATAEPRSGLAPFGAGSVAELKARHQGRPWVLVLWSVSCEPCRNELPHWAAWRKKRPDVAVELVSTDGEGETPLALQLLGDKGLANDPGWIFADDFVERLRHAIDPGWYGELPRTLFYAADGGREASSGVVDSTWLAGWYGRQAVRR